MTEEELIAFVKKEIFENAYKFYEDKGVDAVFDYADKVGIHEYLYCKDCDMDVPILDNTCLVCGSLNVENPYDASKGYGFSLT